jgi:hypothetical protein
MVGEFLVSIGMTSPRLVCGMKLPTQRHVETGINKDLVHLSKMAAFSSLVPSPS